MSLAATGCKLAVIHLFVSSSKYALSAMTPLSFVVSLVSRKGGGLTAGTPVDAMGLAPGESVVLNDSVEPMAALAATSTALPLALASALPPLDTDDAGCCEEAPV